MAGQDVAGLLLKIDASTELLRRELATAAVQTDQWADKMQASATRGADALSRVDVAAGRLGKNFDILKTAAAGLIAGIGIDAISGLASRGLEYASSLGEVSQQLGVTTKDLQVFRYAASQTGIEQATMDQSLARLTKTLGEAKLGSASAAKAFAQLGISQQQVAELNTGEAMRLIAERLSKIEDPARRAAIEVDLFGKAGQKLDTLLAGGTGQIDELTNAANRLGIVLSSEQIQKADDAADKLSAVKQVLSAQIAGVVADNAGAILQLANALVQVGAAAGSAFQKVQDFYEGSRKIRQDRGVIATLLASDAEKLAIGNGIRVKSEMLASIRAFAAAPEPSALPTVNTKTSKPSNGGSSKTTKPTLSSAQLRGQEGYLPFIDYSGDLLDGAGKRNIGEDEVRFATAYLGKLQEIRSVAQDVPPINPITAEAAAAAEQFSSNLSRNLSQAIVYGQSLGDALINSIKAAAAELITSGLLDLLNGGKGGDGGILGGLFSAGISLFGGGRAAGGPVEPGKAYLVGENRPEIFVPSTRGAIRSRAPEGGGQGGGSVAVSVDVTPSPLFITAVRVQAADAGQQAAAGVIRSAGRTGIPGGAG